MTICQARVLEGRQTARGSAATARRWPRLGRHVAEVQLEPGNGFCWAHTAQPAPPHRLAFGEAIRELREERDVSQEAFALKCGVDRSHYGGMERGERNPNLTTVFKNQFSDRSAHARAGIDATRSWRQPALPARGPAARVWRPR